MSTRIRLVCVLLMPMLSFAAGLIDTTSEKTISESLKGEKPEDVAVINQLVCDAGHGLDRNDPKGKALALERLRARLQGKTVNQVASEMRTQVKAEGDKFQAAAEAMVLERRKKWGQRVSNIATVVPGTTKENVTKLLGEPDAKSDSETVENWLYRYDASQHGKQIWIDAVAIQISDGTVVKVILTPERHDVEVMAAPTQK